MLYVYQSLECTTLRVNPNVNYRVGVTVMCQCGFIDDNKCTTLGGGCQQWWRLCMCWDRRLSGTLHLLLDVAVKLKLL